MRPALASSSDRIEQKRRGVVKAGGRPKVVASERDRGNWDRRFGLSDRVVGGNGALQSGYGVGAGGGDGWVVFDRRCPAGVVASAPRWAPDRVFVEP